MCINASLDTYIHNILYLFCTRQPVIKKDIVYLFTYDCFLFETRVYIFLLVKFKFMIYNNKVKNIY